MRVSLHLAWDRFRHRLHLLPAGAPPLPKLADIYEEALAHYDVKPYPGEITLFLAKHHLAGFKDRLGGWGDVAQAGVRFFPLPISPRASLVEPYVAQLAKLFRTCLDEASEKSKIAAAGIRQYLRARISFDQSNILTRKGGWSRIFRRKRPFLCGSYFT